MGPSGHTDLVQLASIMVPNNVSNGKSKKKKETHSTSTKLSNLAQRLKDKISNYKKQQGNKFFKDWHIIHM